MKEFRKIKLYSNDSSNILEIWHSVLSKTDTVMMFVVLRERCGCACRHRACDRCDVECWKQLQLNINQSSTKVTRDYYVEQNKVQQKVTERKKLKEITYKQVHT